MRWRTASPTCYGLLLFSLLPDVPHVAAQELQVRPERLDLGVGKPGIGLTDTFFVHNGGADELIVLLSVDDAGPFGVAPDTLRIPAGADRLAIVSFSARQTGQFEGQISFEFKKLFGSRKLSFPVAARVARPRLELPFPIQPR